MPRLGDFKKSFKSTKIKINAFFHRPQWKEALIFFAFVLLAFGFWYLLSLQQDYEIELSIPVKYKNVPPEISFTDTIPDRIVLRVRDKGSTLLNYTVARTFAPIEANLKDIPIRDGSFSIERKEIETDIYKQLFSTTSLVSFEPSQIALKYSKRMEKEVPVSFNGTLNLSPGFHRAGEVQINPSTVHIYAAQAILDTISAVKTSYMEIKKVNKSITRTFPLQKINGVSFNPEAVTVTIPVEEFTDKSLDIAIVIDDIPADYTVRLFPPTAKVTCSVPLSRFAELSEDMFSIRIPFRDLEQNLTGVTAIRLQNKPDWVRSFSLSPDKIEFILEQHREEVSNDD